MLKEFYKGNVHREAYVRAKERLSAAAADVETVGRTIPVCYNGDLFSVSDTERFLVEYPDSDDLMFGRGMLIDPALVMRLRAKSADPAGKKRCKKTASGKQKHSMGGRGEASIGHSRFLWAAGGGLRSGAVRGTGRTI